MSRARVGRYSYAVTFLDEYERILTALHEGDVFGQTSKSRTLEVVLRAGLGVFEAVRIRNGKVTFDWAGRRHSIMRYMLPADVIDGMDRLEDQGLSSSFVFNRLFEEGLDVIAAQNPAASRVVAPYKVRTVDAAPEPVWEETHKVVVRRVLGEPTVRT